MANTEYHIIASQPAMLLDSMNNPVDGLIIRFSFGNNMIGEIKVSKADFNAGKAKELIINYIIRFNELV